MIKIESRSQLMFKALKSKGAKRIKSNYNGFNLDIEYSFQPTEPMNGIQAEIEEISEILYNGEDILALLEPQEKDIINAIWEEWKNASR